MSFCFLTQEVASFGEADIIWFLHDLSTSGQTSLALNYHLAAVDHLTYFYMWACLPAKVCVCVCVCVCECVLVYVCVGVCVCVVRPPASVCVRACMPARMCVCVCT